MRTEIPRQMVHLSGLFFVLFAQFLTRETTVMYFFMITFFFFIYSWYIRTQQNKMMKLLHAAESRIRSFALGFERENVKAPFIGAMFFYLSFTVAFIIFPFNIASAACVMLAVGDSLSTLVGVKFGRHKLGKRSIEGSMACFAGSFFAGMIFVNPMVALAGALAAALSEHVPKIDDNITIPLISGVVMYIFLLF